MPTIKFEKVMRDSAANKQRIENGERGLTYDYKVIIDGEHRATFWREVWSIGFTLQDLNHVNLTKLIESHNRLTGVTRMVPDPINHINKGRFEHTISSMLTEGRIPTLAEQEYDRMRNRAEADDRAFDQHIDDVRRCKQRAAEQMFDALQSVIDLTTYKQGPGYHIASVAVQLVREALDAATYKPTGDDDNG